jgi:hypothetical protein
MIAIPAIAPTTIPPIAPPDIPELDDVGGIAEAEADGDAVADTAAVVGKLWDAIAVADAVGDKDAGVLDARSFAALKERVVAEGCEDRRDENVLFICFSVRFVSGFSGVAQQMLI